MRTLKPLFIRELGVLHYMGYIPAFRVIFANAVGLHTLLKWHFYGLDWLSLNYSFFQLKRWRSWNLFPEDWLVGDHTRPWIYNAHLMFKHQNPVYQAKRLECNIIVYLSNARTDFCSLNKHQVYTIVNFTFGSSLVLTVGVAKRSWRLSGAKICHDAMRVTS